MSDSTDWKKVKLGALQLDRVIFKFMILAALWFGGVSAAFRSDLVSKWISVCCVTVLGLMAGLFLARHSKP